jgi:hypothetical protein
LFANSSGLGYWRRSSFGSRNPGKLSRTTPLSSTSSALTAVSFPVFHRLSYYFYNFPNADATVSILGVAAIMATDFYLIRDQKLDVREFYKPGGKYWYWHGIHWRAGTYRTILAENPTAELTFPLIHLKSLGLGHLVSSHQRLDQMYRR